MANCVLSDDLYPTFLVLLLQNEKNHILAEAFVALLLAKVTPSIQTSVYSYPCYLSACPKLNLALRSVCSPMLCCPCVVGSPLLSRRPAFLAPAINPKSKSGVHQHPVMNQSMIAPVIAAEDLRRQLRITRD